MITRFFPLCVWKMNCSLSFRPWLLEPLKPRSCLDELAEVKTGLPVGKARLLLVTAIGFGFGSKPERGLRANAEPQTEHRTLKIQHLTNDCREAIREVDGRCLMLDAGCFRIRLSPNGKASRVFSNRAEARSYD